jgi:hypothetical protein
MPVCHYRSLRRRLHIAIRALGLSATGRRVQRSEVRGGGLLRLLLLLRLLRRLVHVVMVLPLRICIRMRCRRWMATRVHSLWRASDFLAQVGLVSFATGSRPPWLPRQRYAGRRRWLIQRLRL